MEPVIFSRMSIVNFHHETRQEVVHIELDDEFSHQELSHELSQSGHVDVVEPPDHPQFEQDVGGAGLNEDQSGDPNDALSFPSFFGSAVQSAGNDVFACGSISHSEYDVSEFKMGMSPGLSISDESHLEGGFGTSSSTQMLDESK